MSGGVDSSVAVALLRDAGHQVEGATMKLWGGESDSGCCSISDVEDARRVAAQLGVPHHVFNFTQDFESQVVSHYVSSHRDGLVPNPCIECNRSIKFDVFLDRAIRVGFDAIATGHYAKVEQDGPQFRLRRAHDMTKDQSYVLSVLNQRALSRVLLPLGDLAKTEVREMARSLGLRTSEKPDSQDVCFITSKGGRKEFMEARVQLTKGVLIDAQTRTPIGETDSLELLTVGQRKGISSGVSSVKTPTRRFVTEIDLHNKIATVGSYEDLLTDQVKLGPPTWTGEPIEQGQLVLMQFSAHGLAVPARWIGDHVVLDHEIRKPAPGQTAAIYQDDYVAGSATIIK